MYYDVWVKIDQVLLFLLCYAKFFKSILLFFLFSQNFDVLPKDKIGRNKIKQGEYVT